MAFASDVSEEVEIQAGPTQGASITATDDAVRIEYRFPVSVDEAGMVLRPLPTPWNPAYLDGTPGEEGWWTEVLVEGPDGLVSLGTTIGQESIVIDANVLDGAADALEGGAGNATPEVDVDANGDGSMDVNASIGPVSMNLRLVVHAPAGALGEAGSQRLNYELARPDDEKGEGSGGSLQESVPLILTLDVLPGADAVADEGPFAPQPPACGAPCGIHWQGLAAATILGLAASFGAGYVLSRIRTNMPPPELEPAPRLSRRLEVVPKSRPPRLDVSPSQTRLGRF